ncbi:unnamed protein product [Lymnaea stagnalis]|uniref:Uncharacterized protein n=1 Tax=Lymnaea stagnalis TaxID=6523 RepID=A0AAV2HIQ1_LYMST
MPEAKRESLVQQRLTNECYFCERMRLTGREVPFYPSRKPTKSQWAFSLKNKCHSCPAKAYDAWRNKFEIHPKDGRVISIVQCVISRQPLNKLRRGNDSCT